MYTHSARGCYSVSPLLPAGYNVARFSELVYAVSPLGFEESGIQYIRRMIWSYFSKKGKDARPFFEQKKGKEYIYTRSFTKQKREKNMRSGEICHHCEIV